MELCLTCMPDSFNHAAGAANRLAYILTHVLGGTLLWSGLAWAANHYGLDMALARALYDPAHHVFPMGKWRWLDMLGHRIVLVLPVGIALLAFAAALSSYWIPVWKRWRGPALAIVLTSLTGMLLIAQLKHYTALPRPYHLSEFGGHAAYPLTWWAAARNQGAGALPSSHAGAGYSLLVLYFLAWAHGSSVWRWRGLAAGIACGLLFSSVRIAQGAHFLSQTLWSAALMWLLASVFFYPLIARRHTWPIRSKSVSESVWSI